MSAAYADAVKRKNGTRQTVTLPILQVPKGHCWLNLIWKDSLEGMNVVTIDGTADELCLLINLTARRV